MPGFGPMDPPSLSRLVAPALSALCARRLPRSSRRLAADSVFASQHQPLSLGLACPAPSPGPRREEKEPGSLRSDAPDSLLDSPASARLAGGLGAPGAAAAAAAAAAGVAAAAAAPGMYQSPRRLCSALLQRDAPGLRRPPGPPPRRRSPAPAAAPRLASPRLLAAASAARGIARSCSRTGECAAVPGGERGGGQHAAATWRRRGMNGKPGAAGRWGRTGKRVPLSLSRCLRSPLRLCPRLPLPGACTASGKNRNPAGASSLILTVRCRAFCISRS